MIAAGTINCLITQRQFLSPTAQACARIQTDKYKSKQSTNNFTHFPLFIHGDEDPNANAKVQYCDDDTEKSDNSNFLSESDFATSVHAMPMSDVQEHHQLESKYWVGNIWVWR